MKPIYETPEPTPTEMRYLLTGDVFRFPNSSPGTAYEVTQVDNGRVRYQCMHSGRQLSSKDKEWYKVVELLS